MGKLNGICPVPWTSIGINNNGDYRMCVQSATKKPERGLCRHNNKVLHVETSSIDAARNSDIFKQTRLSMMSGNFSENCIRCKTEESSGLESRRLTELKRYQNIFSDDYAVTNTDVDGIIDTKKTLLMDIDVRLDNICNLACRHCGPTESIKWYKEWPVLMNKSTFKSYEHTVTIINGSNDKNSPYGWTERVNVLNIFDKLEHLKTIYLSGGEPLINKQHLSLLQLYVDKKLSYDIELSYNTNLTLLPTGILDIWKEFKTVLLGCSLDGIGKVNDYIRYPSKWENIVKTIKEIESYDIENIRPWLTFTWNIYNSLDVLNVIDWVLEQKFRRFNKWAKTPVFTYHPLHNPEYLCVTSIPTYAKEAIANKFDSWLSTNKNKYGIIQYNMIEQLLNSMIKFMYSKDTSSCFDQFTLYTNKLDKLRNQSFKNVDPKLYGILYE